MRCCRATPSFGDEETSAIAAARSGFCGWGGVLMGATGNAVDNKVNGEQQQWANGNGGVGLASKLVDGEVTQRETEYRNNNNNFSANASSSSSGGSGGGGDGAGSHLMLQLQLQQQQTQQRRAGPSGWRSSNRRYSLLRCILCNLKQNHAQVKQSQQQQQENDQEVRLQSPSPSQPQAIVVAVVVGASIDHQIQQQEPQLTHTNTKQQRCTSAGGAGVGGVSYCARGGGSKSAHNQGGVGVYIDGCREALL